MPNAKIIGWGKCVPPAVLHNNDLATFLDTSDEWVASRTGIRERRISHVLCSDLATVAAQRALACADVEPDSLDLIIFGTSSADAAFPNSASAVQKNIGAGRAACFDLNAACTSFVYGLSMATSLIQSGAMKRILIIGSEIISHWLDWTKRDTAVLFGDGAGAMVVEASEDKLGLLSFKLGCDGVARDALSVPNSGTGRSRFADIDGLYDIYFDGQEIFKRAVRGMSEAADEALEQAGVAKEDIAFLVPHQANMRIIETLAKRAKIPMEKVMVNIHKYGNTSAATVPIAFCEALEEGKIKPGDTLLTAAFGAGLTWGAGVIQWGDRVTPLKTSDAELPPCDKTAVEILQPAIDGCKKAAGLAD